MKRVIFAVLILAVLTGTVVMTVMALTTVIDGPMLGTDDGVTFKTTRFFAIPTSTLAGVSTYGSAASGVTILPDKARTSIVYLAGANATTGVSVTLTTPTIGANQEGTYIVIYQQPAAGTCKIAHSTAVLAPSGVSNFALTATAGATDYVTYKYNSTIGKWSVIDGPYDMR